MQIDKPSKHNLKRIILALPIILIISAGWLYFFQPELNIKSPAAVLVVLMLIGINAFIITIFKQKKIAKNIVSILDFKAAKLVGFYSILGVIFVLYLIIGGISGANILRSKAYVKQMPMEVLEIQDFAEQVNPESIGTSTLPIIDKEIALRKAEGQLSTYGSQYSIGDSFTLINIKENGVERLVRVAPLEYNGLVVAATHYNTGSVGYVMVDVVTEEAKFIEVKEGIKYLESGLLNRNLSRYIWMNYPTSLITDYSFEIDDEGNPYWVASVYDNEVGLFSGQNPIGVVLVNAVNGEINRYDIKDVPSWVDRVVPSEQAMTQANKALTYKNGWFNATFGAKKEVFNLTEEYNYISLKGKTYLYSGITSPNNADETSVGFVLIDLRTKETKMYRIQGITEYRAMEIARSHQSVKAQNLNATEPLLVNIEGQPTYFMTLKNNVQRQWYVLVRVSDGAIVLNQNLRDCKSEYISLLSNQNGSPITDGLESVSGVVSRVRQSKGDILEFVFANDVDKIYMVPISLGVDTRFLQAGDTVTVKFLPSDDGTYLVRELVNDTLRIK
ncbi:MAG: hypothetical protein FD141_1563 [Fusobacteria bacterium]|nr:MAG: hypothetical protein FD141_1563 [Fusobacteriota bacterium]KAF0230276.1 MAG: hypothetical protein FD182_666 [Fusobacteriota bacterium]